MNQNTMITSFFIGGGVLDVEVLTTRSKLFILHKFEITNL